MNSEDSPDLTETVEKIIAGRDADPLPESPVSDQVTDAEIDVLDNVRVPCNVKMNSSPAGFAVTFCYNDEKTPAQETVAVFPTAPESREFIANALDMFRKVKSIRATGRTFRELFRGTEKADAISD